MNRKAQNRQRGNTPLRQFGIVLFFLIFCGLTGFARITQSSGDSSHARDSVKKPPSGVINELAASELLQRSANFREHQVVLKQSRNFILVKNEIEDVNNFLGKGFSYPVIRHEIAQLIQWKELAVEGVITHQDSIQTVRNLTTTSTLLNELLNRTNNRLSQILTYHKELGKLQYVLDSLAMDSVLYKVPSDSVEMANYYQKLQFLTRDLVPVNRVLKSSLDSIQKLEIQVNLLKFNLESAISKTESLRARLFDQFNTNELGHFGRSQNNERPVGQIISYSAGKAKLVLLFYVVNHMRMMILMVLFIIGLHFYLVLLRRKVSKENVPDNLTDREIVLQKPWATAILLVFTIFPLFLPMPPFVLNGLIWMTCAVALSVMIRKSVSRFGFNAWLFFILLFVLAFVSNLILRQSSFERWSMLFLSITGLASGIYFLATKKRKEVQEKVIIFSIGLMALLQVPALYYNLTGGFNFAKIFMTNGLILVLVAFLVFWTARFVNIILRISYYFYLVSEGKKRSLSDTMTNTRVPLYYYFIFFTDWFILIGRDFFYYQTIIDPFRDSLSTTRTIGAFSFNYKSILIFFLVLVGSGVISRVVSFLASDNLAKSDTPKKNRLGSWLVLIRIMIITAGVLIAFIAAGIPMDRFAFVLGAMSVGIGFGLQSLVNNLISGLVIAFEKPVNVGDIVEFAGRTGTMKSIGIRSSVVTTLDGADVIIPNGDLLNQHLVNWTLGNSRRRVDLILNVAFGSDIDQLKKLLVKLMLDDQRILSDPYPIVLVNKFNNDSIELYLRFWVAHFDTARDVRSDLIPAIEAIFRELKIEIPFPRQDVHVL